MGTRADFYVGRGKKAEWLGSIAWDGYPGGMPDDVKKATTEAGFRQAVQTFLDGRNGDATYPKDGWPWPWKDSQTTDYAYAFDGGKVYASCFGRAWFEAVGPEPDLDGPKVAVFPNMEAIQKVTFGGRSGLMIFGGPKLPWTASQVQFEKAKRKASSKLLTVVPLSPLLYEVTGGSKPHKVNLTPKVMHKCSCMDWNIRGRSQGYFCKHIAAVEEFQGRQDAMKQTEVTGLLDEETKALLRRAADMRMRGGK